jgi:hypothetical protein
LQLDALAQKQNPTVVSASSARESLLQTCPISSTTEPCMTIPAPNPQPPDAPPIRPGIKPTLPEEPSQSPTLPMIDPEPPQQPAIVSDQQEEPHDGN